MGFPANLLKVAPRKLAMLHAAHQLKDLAAPPSNKLHKLHDDREGQHAIWINEKFRLCFKWRDGDALDVEITHYH
jgi:toxin HigB-1